jgi:hypothetical protein
MPPQIVQVGFVLISVNKNTGKEDGYPVQKAFPFDGSTTVKDIIRGCFRYGEETMRSRFEYPESEMVLIVVNGADSAYFPSNDMRVIEFPLFMEKWQSGNTVILAMTAKKALDHFSSASTSGLAKQRSPVQGPSTPASPPSPTHEPRRLPQRRGSRDPASPLTRKNSRSPKNSPRQGPRDLQPTASVSSMPSDTGAIHIVFFTPLGERATVTMTYKHGEPVKRVLEDCCRKLNVSCKDVDLDPELMCLLYRQTNGTERIFEYSDRLPISKDPNFFPELFLCVSKKIAKERGMKMPLRHRPTTFTEEQLELDARMEYKEKHILFMLKNQRAKKASEAESNEKLAASRKTLSRLEEEWATVQFAQRDVDRLEEQIKFYTDFLQSACEREEALRSQLRELVTETI